MLHSKGMLILEYTKFKTSSYCGWKRSAVQIIGDLYERNRIMKWKIFKEVCGASCNHLEYYR